MSEVPTENSRELWVSAVPTVLKSVNVSKLLPVSQLNGALDAKIKTARTEFKIDKENYANAMRGCLLQTLVPLPKELTYKIWFKLA